MAHQLAETERAAGEVIRKALERSEQPLTAAQLIRHLTGPFKLARDRLDVLLEQQAASGALYRYAPYRSKLPRYWTRSPGDYARLVIGKELSRRPMTRSELRRATAASLRGISDADRRAIVGAMLEAGEIREHPPVPPSRTSRLAVGPPDPAPYFRQAVTRLQKLVAELELAGVPPQRSLEALWRQLQPAGAGAGPPAATASTGREAPPTGTAAAATEAPVAVPEAAASGAEAEPLATPVAEPPAVEQRILAAMRAIEPGAELGALVSIRALRRATQLGDLTKPAFDQSVLALAAQGTVALHQHDYPSALTEDQRQELVQDQQGNFYVGIALRP